MSRACLVCLVLLFTLPSWATAGEEIGPCDFGTCGGCNVSVTVDPGHLTSLVQVTVSSPPWENIKEQGVVNAGARPVQNDACGAVCVAPMETWGQVMDCEDMTADCGECPEE